jgi:hypothetical protein
MRADAALYLNRRIRPPEMKGPPMQFHILSFEGHDPYACAGGLASRINGLVRTLAEVGFETHLWFVGDPQLSGHEAQGQLHLHRWCQWISQYHPGGVYDGEEGKRANYGTSLPPFLCNEVLLPHLLQGKRAVILAEEWHTVDAVLHVDWLLRMAGVRHQVKIFWNANNTFAFERIDWGRLAQAATITTVSRYMKHLMQGLGVNPLVIPNGLSTDTLVPPECAAVAAFKSRTKGRTVVSKVARWDPDKSYSHHEPFGLVGLETMAAGGVACIGYTGEDYAVPGHNALALETNDPQEFLDLFGTLRLNPAIERALRRAGRATAQHYTWSKIVHRLLLPRLHLIACPSNGTKTVIPLSEGKLTLTLGSTATQRASIDYW